MTFGILEDTYLVNSYTPLAHAVDSPSIAIDKVCGTAEIHFGSYGLEGASIEGDLDDLQKLQAAVQRAIAELSKPFSRG